jgi:hypothetical protein
MGCELNPKIGMILGPVFFSLVGIESIGVLAIQCLR